MRYLQTLDLRFAKNVDLKRFIPESPLQISKAILNMDLRVCVGRFRGYQKPFQRKFLYNHY